MNTALHFLTKISRSISFLALILAVLAQLSVPPILASTVEDSFSDAYKSTNVSSDTQELEVQREADQASQTKHYSEASAKYLAAAAYSFTSGNFERARPAFDKAFLMAAQLSTDEQKQMLQTLSQVISSSRADGDLDTYKYFAQQRLKLLQKNLGSNPDQRYHEVQTLALSCSQHKRFKEAQSLLLETLKDLESIKPLPQTYGTCEATLARVFDEGGDKDEAHKYYDQALKFVRQSPDLHNYEHVLHSYLWFLLQNKMFKEAAPIADEYYTYTTAPAQARWRNRVSYGMIARLFAESDVDEANKYYRAAFENDMEGTKTAMNMGYGSTCVAWAEMLHKFGRTSEAVAVLQEGMAFCRTAKWPDAFERNMRMMIEPCERYMRDSHRNSEADQLRTSYEKEKLARKESVRENRDTWLAQASNNAQKPAEKIQALTEMSYRAFDAQKCDEGLKSLKSAVDAYEENADNKDSERMYNYFTNISARLKKCADDQESTPLLLRIVRARMVAGFQDPDDPTNFRCTWGSTTIDAFSDYLNLAGSNRKSILDALLTDAKASAKPSNVILVLRQTNQFSPVSESGLANLEEIEEWKIKENDPVLLFSTMMQIADWSINLNQFDKAVTKWKQAVDLAEKVKLQTPNRRISSLPMSLQNIGKAFANKNQLGKAGDVYIVAYKMSLHEPREYQAQMIAKAIEELAVKYREVGDTASGESLLRNVLELSKAERGSDSLLERMWLIKLADFYADSGEKVKAKNACVSFLASVSKPGLSVSKATMDDMEKHVQALKRDGFSSEAELVLKKLHELESHQCEMTDPVKNKN